LNLLTNAIKFTPERGRVEVTVDEVDGGQGRIRVSDTGIGIEPDFLPYIFNRFSQEDRGPNRTHGGLGLGLAIVRSLVTAHGGTVEVESAGRTMGSTFTVLLPLMKGYGKTAPKAQAEPPEQPAAEGIQDVRILVVEDDPGTREALTEMLGLNGAEVRAAESATRALKVFEEFKPELLICDIAMPDEDGYALLGRIQALGPKGGGNVPALALTALAGEEDRRRAFAAGFQMHMAKPVDVDRLLTALQGLLRSAPHASADERQPSP
jgi:two-component system CheB/CheR fusion protein